MHTASLTPSSTHLGLHHDLPVAPGSTTSRVLLDNGPIRVVVFAFAAGQQLTEHTSPRAVVCQVTEGTLAFEIDGQTHDVTTGDIIYLAPDAPHALRAVTAGRLTLTMIDVSAEPDACAPSGTAPTHTASSPDGP